MAPVAGVVQAKPIFQDINGKYIMEKKTTGSCHLGASTCPSEPKWRFKWKTIIIKSLLLILLLVLVISWGC